jgi:hypothetical protein
MCRLLATLILVCAVPLATAQANAAAQPGGAGRRVGRCAYASLVRTIQAQAAETEKLRFEHRITQRQYAGRWNAIHVEESRLHAMAVNSRGVCPMPRMTFESKMRQFRSM